MPTLNLNLNSSRAKPAGTGGIVLGPSIKINLGVAGMTYITGNNWNHIEQSGTGVQVIRGESSGATRASLINAAGALTGMTIDLITFMQGESNGQLTDGIYPAAANRWEWTTFAGGRSFKIHNMIVGKLYMHKIMCSVDIGIPSAHNVNYSLIGATTIVITNFDENGNVTNLLGGPGGLTLAPNGSGDIEHLLDIATNIGQVSVVEIFPIL